METSNGRECPDCSLPGGQRKASHLEHAKWIYLATLIDECGGDLARISLFWDRGSDSDTTLRSLIRAYGLSERLEAARIRSRENHPTSRRPEPPR